MKTLRILVIILLPALGFVGCRKSDIRPGCGNENAAQTEASTEAPVNGRINTHMGEDSPGVTEEEPTTNDIVGSGDDDRDGGDKKPKSAGR